MPAIHLLGGVSLEGELGAVRGGAAQRHRVALLALLALAAPKSMSRDKLVAYLWPDRDHDHARNLLKQGVHALRRAFGDGVILSAGDELRFNSELVPCDVIAFEAALASGELARAVGLYAGPLLDGFHLPSACDFEQRIDVERDRLRRRVIQALQGLGEQAAACGDWSRAAEHWRRVAEEEPSNGFVTMRFMEALDASGDRAGAIQQARLHALVLKQQFDAIPDERVMALAARLRTERISGDRQASDPGASNRLPPASARTRRRAERAEPRASSSTSPSYALVGRASECERLRAIWAATAGGRPHFALITGEAGIGKTRLAEEMLEWASKEGIESARTRSYASEGELAYAPVTDWLRSSTLSSSLDELDPAWLVEVARLLPELREDRRDLPPPEPLTESWQRQRLFTGLARAVLARRNALVLLIDDLQWCDPDTLQWLHYLLRLDVDTRVLVVGTARSEEIGPGHPLTSFVYDLRQLGQLTELPLGALSADETAMLASQVARGELGADAAALVYRETEGHPLFVVETVRAQSLDALSPHGAAAGSIGATAAPIAANGRSLPPRVQAVIERRLAQLSPAAQRLAGVAATIGRDFTLSVLSRACESDDGFPDAPLDSLDELWQRRVIREHGTGRFDFSHDRLREVAYAVMGPVRRSVLHRRVAEALRRQSAADLDAVSGQIAGHYDKGGVIEEAILFYQRAAAVAERLYANEEAISHLDRALELLARLPADADRDRRELALRTALLPPLRAAQGWGAEALRETALRARVLCDRVGTAAERYRALTELAFFQLVRGTDLRATLPTAEDALELALAQDDSCLLTPSYQAVAATLCQSGEFLRARAHIERATAVYDLRCHRRQVELFGMDFGVLSYAFAAHIEWHLGYPDRAVRTSLHGRELAESLGHPFSQSFALAYDAMLYQFLGDADVVADRAASVVDLTRRHGFAYYHAWGTILEGWAACERGDRARGVRQMRDGLIAIRATGADARRPYYLTLLAAQRAKAGDGAEAFALLDEALTFAEASGAHFQTSEIYRLRGELLLARDERDACVAEDVLGRARDFARRQEARVLELRATVSLARLLQERGRLEEARELLRPIAGWFREGFDTADVMCARSLLAELSRQAV